MKMLIFVLLAATNCASAPAASSSGGSGLNLYGKMFTLSGYGGLRIYSPNMPPPWLSPTPYSSRGYTSRYNYKVFMRQRTKYPTTPTAPYYAQNEEAYFLNEKPYFSKEESYIPNGNPYTTREKSYTPSEEPSTPSEEPYTPSEEPYTPSEEPYTPSEEPSTPSEEPSTPSEEPSTPSEEPYTPSEEPYTPSEEPSTPSEEPYTPSEEPYTPSEEPYTPSEEPYTPSEEPYTRTTTKEPYTPTRTPYTTRSYTTIPWTTAPTTRGVSVCLRYITDSGGLPIFTLSPSSTPLRLGSYGPLAYTLSFNGYSSTSLTPSIRLWSYVRQNMWTSICVTVDTMKNVVQMFRNSNMSSRKLLPAQYNWSGEPVIDFSGSEGQVTDIQVWDFPLRYQEVLYYMSSGFYGPYQGSVLSWSYISYSVRGKTLLEENYEQQKKLPSDGETQDHHLKWDRKHRKHLSYQKLRQLI